MDPVASSRSSPRRCPVVSSKATPSSPSNHRRNPMRRDRDSHDATKNRTLPLSNHQREVLTPPTSPPSPVIQAQSATTLEDRHHVSSSRSRMPALERLAHESHVDPHQAHNLGQTHLSLSHAEEFQNIEIQYEDNFNPSLFDFNEPEVPLEHEHGPPSLHGGMRPTQQPSQHPLIPISARLRE